MLKETTDLYNNCESALIIIHTVSNHNLKKLCSGALTLKTTAEDLEILEQLHPWISFIRRLLFAWNTTPLPFDISKSEDLKSEYEKLTSLWNEKKSFIQEPARSQVDDLLSRVDGMSISESSLQHAYFKLQDEAFENTFVCQKYWGWGIDNSRLGKISGISGIQHPGQIEAPSTKACFFGSPRIYDLKSQSFLWTAPRFKEVHFLAYEHTGTSIPSWNQNSINFDKDKKAECPWPYKVESYNFISSEEAVEPPLEIEEIEHFPVNVDGLIKNLNNQDCDSSEGKEVDCILLLSENDKIIPLRQHSDPDCLALDKRIKIDRKDADEIIPGDIILVRSSSGDTLKEVEMSQKSDEWNEALRLHKQWKDELSRVIDLGLVSEVKDAAGQTANNIRNWANPQNHGPENKQTFVDLMNYLGMGKEVESTWRTIQELRGFGHIHGNDASESLRAAFMKLDKNEQKELLTKGLLVKYLHDDHDAASMKAIIVKEVISYSAKIRPSLINRQLTTDKSLWL